MARSPKGLISTEPGDPQDSGFFWEAKGSGERIFGSPPLKPGDEYVLRGPDPLQEIREQFARWREIVSRYVETIPMPERTRERLNRLGLHRLASMPYLIKRGKEGVLDRSAVAQEVLTRIAIVESCLKDFECNNRYLVDCPARSRSISRASGYLMEATYHMSLCLIDVHQLTVIDNEPAIVAEIKRKEGTKERVETSRKDNAERYTRMVKDFIDRRGLGKSDTALMAEIGAKQDPPLKRSWAIEVITRECGRRGIVL
jgi:hypothetical protein